MCNELGYKVNGSWVNEKWYRSSGEFKLTNTGALGSRSACGIAPTLPVRVTINTRRRIKVKCNFHGEFSLLFYLSTQE